MARGPVASSPRLRSQCSSTRSGVRQVMPPLMTVEPPTHLPSAKMIPGLPKIIVVPASRYGASRTAGPGDVEGGEDVGMLIESEEDERTEAEEECAAEAGCVPPAGEVAPSLLGRHRAETAQPAREERRTVLDQVEAERQADAQRPGQVGQEAPDVSQHGLVDRLGEAVAAPAGGGGDRAGGA